VLALLGLDVQDLVQQIIQKLVDLVVPDMASDWVSHLVTWLIALPPITSSGFPSLHKAASDLTSVGFGLLGACLAAAALQHIAEGITGGTPRWADAARRAAVGAIALVSYPTIMAQLLIGTNLLTAALIRHPLVVDGLDKAFGTALAAAAVTHGISFGLAIGAVITVLYFLAALLVFKIGLTAILAVVLLSGSLVWGLYPLPQGEWLLRMWTAGLVTALAVPIAWALVFAAGALLAADTLVFDGAGSYNGTLDDALTDLVKPFSAVACFWLAYKAPGFLLAGARATGFNATSLVRPPNAHHGPGGDARHGAIGRGVQTNADRFRALSSIALQRRGQPLTAETAQSASRSPSRTMKPPSHADPQRTAHNTTGRGGPPRRASDSGEMHGGVLKRVARAPAQFNDWWRALPSQRRQASAKAPTGRGSTTSAHVESTPAGASRPGRPATPRSDPAAPQPQRAGPANESTVKPRPVPRGDQVPNRTHRPQTTATSSLSPTQPRPPTDRPRDLRPDRAPQRPGEPRPPAPPRTVSPPRPRTPRAGDVGDNSAVR
jgi:hypothetical protein